jgi:hypothetical protein
MHTKRLRLITRLAVPLVIALAYFTTAIAHAAKRDQGNARKSGFPMAQQGSNLKMDTGLGRGGMAEDDDCDEDMHAQQAPVRDVARRAPQSRYYAGGESTQRMAPGNYGNSGASEWKGSEWRSAAAGQAPHGAYPGSQQAAYPGAYSGSQSGGYPGAYPGSQPGGYPGAYPGSQSGAYPGSQSGGYPGSQSGGYPGPQGGSYPGYAANNQYPVYQAQGEPQRPTWELVPSDKTLKAALTRWARMAGWQVVWELPVDYEVETRTAVQGTFQEAVGVVAKSMDSAEIPMKAIFYAGNRVLRIVAKGTE